MQRTTRAESLLRVAEALTAQGTQGALAVAREVLPWQPSTTSRTAVTKDKALRVFARDRFIDRYSGSRLLFPGALLAFGAILPDAFPISRTWRVSESHEIFWELWPVVDHVVPVTRRGTNDLDNLVTTSAVNNSAKGAALLEELQWTLLPPPSRSESWDGMLAWFLDLVKRQPDVLENQQLKGWHQAAVRSAA